MLLFSSVSSQNCRLIPPYLCRESLQSYALFQNPSLLHDFLLMQLLSHKRSKFHSSHDSVPLSCLPANGCFLHYSAKQNLHSLLETTRCSTTQQIHPQSSLFPACLHGYHLWTGQLGKLLLLHCKDQRGILVQHLYIAVFLIWRFTTRKQSHITASITNGKHICSQSILEISLFVGHLIWHVP